LKADDGRVSRSGLLTIGVFARSSGLTASALRFYADSGLLEPASVDQVSGYRYYAPGQVERAVTIRRLREIDMPLDRIVAVLEADGGEAARLVDEHVASLTRRAHQARETAAAVKARLDSSAQAQPVLVNGSVFTTAVEQILTATSQDSGFAVLNGVHVEVADSIVLTATDRYRLSTRTLVPTRPNATDWSATVDADDLRLAMPWTRRQHDLRLIPQPGRIRLSGDDMAARECRILAEPFPDYRLMLAALPEVLTRVLISRNAFVHSLENQPDPRTRLRVADSVVSVSGDPITAEVTGPAIVLDFAVTTLYPAISTAVGPDVMLDIAGADQPVVVRSADNGDLTTLVMPVKSESPTHAQEGPAQ
jgi:DNA polymerase III subunit beta